MCYKVINRFLQPTFFFRRKNSCLSFLSSQLSANLKGLLQNVNKENIKSNFISSFLCIHTYIPTYLHTYMCVSISLKSNDDKAFILDEKY